MSSKRPAATELNHDNWDKEEEPEERGKFRPASQDELKNRVIKKAKRHVSITNPTEGADSTKGIFGSFAGLCKETGTSKTPPFAFISKLPVSANGPTSTLASSNFSSGTNISKHIQGPQSSHKGEFKAITPSFSFTSSAESNMEFSKLTDNLSEYYGKLKGLNQAVSAWIKVHVDKNPVCILTPIFKDYQKFLKDIEKDNAQIGSDPISDVQTGSGVTKATITPPNTFQLSGSNINATTVDSVTVMPPISLTNSKLTDSKVNGFGFGVKERSQEANAVKINATTTFNFVSEKTSETDSPVKSFGFAKPSVENAVNLKTFSFNNSKAPAAQSATASDEEEDEDDQPPKAEFKAVIEENAFYSKRCKVFVKKNGNYADKGIGTLYLKQVESTEKTHLLVRANNNLGIVLVNLILSCGLPVKRMGKNNVMLFCLPTPETDKPTSLLLRVKTVEEADELLEAIEKYKK
uniref:RanBD1 domain-containing protein n=1 Tax=Glossina palpalis gambiensis TaxID=67801 RepID=A0A1B0C629_9MUSC